MSYQVASQGSWHAPKDTFPKARAAALKAVELDEQLASRACRARLAFCSGTTGIGPALTVRSSGRCS